MMKQLLLLLTLLTLSFNIWAQEDCPGATDESQVYLHANNIKALIDPSGSLFWDGDDARFTFEGEDNESLATIFAQGLWISSLDPGGNIALAAAQYGKSFGSFDYYPGPLYKDEITQEGLPDLEHCDDWNKTWSVTRQEIEAHIADYEDNGLIDNPIPAIMNWPGRGNANLDFLLTSSSNLAPFWDVNMDAIYQPLQGDYPFLPQDWDSPVPFPEQMTWCVFHTGVSQATDSGANISPRLEIQLLTWAYNCSDNEVLNNTIFTSYKIINFGLESMIDTKIGFWHDFDLGCYTDDYIGSAPDQNTFFVYNALNQDAICPQVNSAGENPPVQSVTILNKPLDKFIYYNNNTDGSFGATDPSTAFEHYNYLNGLFRDGTPITEGGAGYQTAGDITSFAFSGDPNNPEEWSALSESLPGGDRSALGVVAIDEDYQPGQITVIDLAYSYHREPDANHLGNVTAMYENVATIQAIYDADFIDVCTQITEVNEPIWAQKISLFPNPVNDRLSIEYGEITINQLQIWDNYGRLLMTFNEQQPTVNVSALPAGVYYLRMGSNGEHIVREFVKN